MNTEKKDSSVQPSKDSCSFDFWKMENMDKMEEYSVFMSNSWMESDAIGGDSSWGGD